MKVLAKGDVQGIAVDSLAFAYFGHNNRNPLFADKRFDRPWLML